MIFLSPFPACPLQLGLYAVVPDINWIASLVNWQVPTLQLRQKRLSGKALDDTVRHAVQITRTSHSLLFINDHWSQAIDAGAYGVHLGQEDLDHADIKAIHRAGLRLGISTHSDEELQRALSLQPSYIAIGAIYPTTTKIMPTAPQGLKQLQHYLKVIHQHCVNPISTVAIGGINEKNIPSVLATGVGSVAVVRAITEDTNPKKQVKKLLDLVQQHTIPNL